MISTNSHINSSVRIKGHVTHPYMTVAATGSKIIQKINWIISILLRYLHVADFFVILYAYMNRVFSERRSEYAEARRCAAAHIGTLDHPLRGGNAGRQRDGQNYYRDSVHRNLLVTTGRRVTNSRLHCNWGFIHG
jgi:hypothetical protein